MVDIGNKPLTRREAVAIGEVRMGPGAMRLVRTGQAPKGDVLAAARLAGIMAAKRVDGLIPLCHSLKLESVQIGFQFLPDRILIRARARCEGKTGVEMEALSAASVAALTLYDMCKAADRGMTLGPFCLAEKSGGRSGTYRRAGVPKAGAPWL
jgi:cyclic pyranopterin phosphate synthase